MTQPAAPQPQGFSAETVTQAALASAVSAAVAAWLASSTSKVLSAGPVPNLSLLVDGSVFVADAVRRMTEALEKAWLTVFARTGTDMRPFIPSYVETLPYRLDGLAPLANRRASQALADAQKEFADAEKMREAVRESLSAGQYSGYTDRIAQTEASVSVNLARHQVALSAFQRGATVSKTWTTRNDASVRETHRHAEGQTVPFEAPFWVGGIPMQHPGDPAAPPAETANCRCEARYVIAGGNRR